MSRILILNWRDINNKRAGGAEVFIYEMARRFSRDGHKVTWFTSCDSILPKNENLEGIEIIRRGSWLSVFIWGFFYYVFFLRKRIDTIIDCQNGIPFFSALYSSKKVICIIHHVHREVFKYYSPNIFIKYIGIFLEALIPFVYTKSDFVAVSPSTILSMRNLLGITNNVHLIYNGIDQRAFKPGAKTPYPSLLYLGRLKKYKRIDDLIYAFSVVSKKINNARCIIVGTGEDENRLVSLTKTMGLEDHIEFRGFVSDEEKRLALRESWVLVYPSLHEGWGISVIEANASGTIAIGANVAGLCDSIRTDTGLLYDSSSKEELVNCLIGILTNDVKRKELEQKALLWSKNFEWEKSYNRLKLLI